MANRHIQRAPLFDRMSTSRSGGDTVETVLASIRYEVEALLNTRLSVPIGSLAKISRSVATYGIPDLPHFSGLNFGTWSDLCDQIADTITAFEPRLTAIQVTAKKADRFGGRLQLEIRADLRQRPDVGTVSFVVAIPAGSP